MPKVIARHCTKTLSGCFSLQWNGSFVNGRNALKINQPSIKMTWTRPKLTPVDRLRSSLTRRQSRTRRSGDRSHAVSGASRISMRLGVPLRFVFIFTSALVANVRKEISGPPRSPSPFHYRPGVFTAFISFLVAQGSLSHADTRAVYR